MGDLFDALDSGKSEDEILPLITEEAAQEKDPDGWSPLHVAAQNVSTTSFEIFKKLIEVYPAAVGEKNDDGDLSIHIAAANEAPEEVMLALIEADPEICKQADEGPNHALGLVFSEPSFNAGRQHKLERDGCRPSGRWYQTLLQEQ